VGNRPGEGEKHTLAAGHSREGGEMNHEKRWGKKKRSTKEE